MNWWLVICYNFIPINFLRILIKMTKPHLPLLKWAALFEGSSLLVLIFIAMPLKYLANIPAAVKIIGPIHGFLFLSFVAIIFFYLLTRKLPANTTLIGLISAFIPFGSFVFKAKYLQ